MLGSDLMKALSYGPLKDTAVGGSGSGTIPPAQVPVLLQRANAALTSLYTRFPLQQKVVELEAVDGIFVYHLETRFAQTSSSTEVNKYLKDTAADPFLGDVLMVERIYNGTELLPLNDRGNELSWFKQSFNSLRFGYPKTGDRYQIEYRARHPQLPLQPADITQLELDVPPELEAALLAHIAGNVYLGLNMEGAVAKGQLLLTEYENECRFHEERNTFEQWASDDHCKARLRGWP